MNLLHALCEGEKHHHFYFILAIGKLIILPGGDIV